MTKHAPQRRSAHFHWQSKQDLLDCFSSRHHLTIEVIEVEIARALRSFKPRQGQPINPQELWEKAGRSLARRCKDAEILASIHTRKRMEAPAAADDGALPMPPPLSGEVLRFPDRKVDSPVDDDGFFPDDAA